MKTVFRTLVLLLLVFSLTVVLLACADKQKTSQEENDDWIEVDVTTDRTKYAYEQKFGDKNSDAESGAMTSDERVNLPSIKR